MMEDPILEKYYMNEALKEAQNAFDADEVPVGAVVVCGGKIIARAHNLTERLCDATAHAEMQAVTMASDYLGNKYLDRCVLYVTLEPCVMCAGALFWSQISKVIYAASDTKRGFLRIGTSLLHPKTIVEKGFFEEESVALLQRFFKKKRV